MDFNWDQIISTLFGGAAVTTFANYFIWSTIKKIEKIPGEITEIKDKVGEIKFQLASMEIKIKTLDKLQDMTHDHDRKIAILEARRVPPRPVNGNCQDRV